MRDYTLSFYNIHSCKAILDTCHGYSSSIMPSVLMFVYVMSDLPLVLQGYCNILYVINWGPVCLLLLVSSPSNVSLS